jgi:hypothetical protein
VFETVGPTHVKIAITDLILSEFHFVYLLAKLAHSEECPLHEQWQIRCCRVESCAVSALQPSKLILLFLAGMVLVVFDESGRIPQNSRRFPVGNVR